MNGADGEPLPNRTMVLYGTRMGGANSHVEAREFSGGEGTPKELEVA